MSISLNYVALSDVGLVRKNNQDAGYASQNLLVLADGMGGAAAGDIASSVTVAHLAEADDVHSLDDLLPTLRSALVKTQQELADRVFDDPAIAGLGTTCIAIMRTNNKLAMVHIGDSRAYLLRNGKFAQVTHDHTLVQYLVDHGDLTPEEAAHHPKRNVIMRAISDTPESVDLDESVREAIAGDRWLLCSDGLFGVVSSETISATLSTYSDLRECGEVLISLALAGGAPDNVTVVLADVIDNSNLPPNTHLPHIPVVVGSAATDYSRPSRGSTSPAGQAAALLTKESGENDTPYKEHERSTVRRIISRIVFALLVLGVIAAAVWGGYSWTQTQYFISAHNGKIAIYQGIPQEIGSFSFYHLEEETDVKISELTPVAQERLTSPITRGSLKEAKQVVASLEAQRVVSSKSASTSETSPSSGEKE